jgi:hypothetical protein
VVGEKGTTGVTRMVFSVLMPLGIIWGEIQPIHEEKVEISLMIDKRLLLPKVE